MRFVGVLLFVVVLIGDTSCQRPGGGSWADTSSSSSESGSSCSSTSGSSPTLSRCTNCGGQGQVKRQDRRGTDSDGNLVDEYHWERCGWCYGRGER